MPVRRSTATYRVKVGLNYPPDDVRCEPGDLVTDLPAEDVPWLLEQGIIETVDPEEE